MRTKTTTQTHLPTRRGFTLVELLVVIAIIVVLAALVFVGGTRARKAAQRVAAVSTAKNLMTANATYLSDHNGKYVPMWENDDKGNVSVSWVSSEDFRSALGEDTSGNWNPWTIEEQMVDPRVKSLAKGDKDVWSEIVANWGMIQPHNAGTWGDRGAKAQHTAANIADPANTAAFVSAADWIVQWGRQDALSDRLDFVGKEQGAVSYRHDGQAIVVYFDGHAEAQKYEALSRQWENGGRDNVWWGGKIYKQ